jgi:hypothetical protein
MLTTVFRLSKNLEKVGNIHSALKQFIVQSMYLNIQLEPHSKQFPSGLWKNSNHRAVGEWMLFLDRQV